MSTYLVPDEKVVKKKNVFVCISRVHHAFALRPLATRQTFLFQKQKQLIAVQVTGKTPPLKYVTMNYRRGVLEFSVT